MALTITDQAITSDQVHAMARPFEGGGWIVTDYTPVRAKILDRNAAITAVTLAELEAKDGKSAEDDLLIESFRQELGL